MKLNLIAFLIFSLFILSKANSENSDTTEPKLNSSETDSESKIEKDTVVYQQVKPSIKLTSEQEYDKLLNTTDISYLIFYYKRVHKESQDVARHLVKIAAKLEYLSGIIMVDCASKYGQTQEQCLDVFEKPTEYPKLKILVPPLYRYNPYTKKQNKHDEIHYPKESPMFEDSIYNFITTNIISRSSKVTTETLELFTK